MPYRRWNPGCPCCSTNSNFLLSPQIIGGPGASFGLYNSCEGFHTYNEWINATGIITCNAFTDKPGATLLSGVHYLPYLQTVGVGNFYYHMYQKTIPGGIFDQAVYQLYYQVGTINYEYSCGNMLSYVCMASAFFSDNTVPISPVSYTYYEKATDCHIPEKIAYPFGQCTNSNLSPVPTGIHLTWDIIF